MRSTGLCLIVSFLFFSGPLLAQRGFSISSKPSWVVEPEFNTEVPRKADASGYYYLLYDEQVNVATRQIFTQYAVRVINDNGLSSVSSIDKSYDPAYEKLTFHSLYVLRGGKKIDHLKRENFEVIQREENRSRAMYDGSLTAIVDLKDVKVGDVVVYSYTTTGMNPVFKDHFFYTFYFMFSSPTGRIGARMLAPPSKKFTFKNFGKVPELKESMVGGLKSYVWEAKDVGQLSGDDQSPNWYDPYARVQLTDFEDWNALSQWEMNAGAAKGPLSKPLQSFIDSLKSIDDEELRILTAIRTVQDKIRYLSFNNGINGYTPNAPSKVFSNKYGDCQDKSVLLATILNGIGVESYPLVVSTEKGKVMNDLLPSPWNFNHVITQFRFRDSTYYADGTISSQRGPLEKLWTPNYCYGLSLDPKNPGLVPIPVPVVNHSVIRVTEDFKFKEVGGPATLTVETTYSGREADSQRENFRSTSMSDMEDGYIDYYASDYPEISMSKPLRYEDDSVRNIFTVYEEYDVPGFWRYDSAKSHYEAETYARYVATYLERPKSKVRKSPLRLRHPVDVELLITIHLSEPWNVTEADETVTGPGFKFGMTRSYSDPFIRMRYSYVTNADHVAVDKMTQYLTKVDEVQEYLGYMLTYGNEEELAVVQDVPSNRFWLLSLATLAFVGYVVYLLYKHYFA